MGPQSHPLIEVFAEIPDYRIHRGMRYSLVALRALACRERAQKCSCHYDTLSSG